ncbi:MAG TPA: DUF5668 domain-containing protein [Candidatus Sulfotelmatobacter sp.]
MNCATHNDVAAVAFCRTCGKPLCSTCTRDVRGVIYCEPCLAARLDGTTPTTGFTPVPLPPPQTGYQQFMDQGLGVKVGPGPSSGPNPAVAGILAGFFPFGVGAVYCSQYAKGLAHLVIFVLMIVGLSSDLPWYVDMVLGISLGFFYFYQIIDAVRTAKAVQLGQPAPDPFGLAQTFGAGSGEKIDPAKVPAGAVILIGLGVLFLLHTVGLFEFGLHRFWPLLLIFLGCWIFAKNRGLIASNRRCCQCERCSTRRLMGPAVLVTLGVLFLLDSAGSVGFERTWPAILLVVGVVKLVQSNASSEGHTGHLPPFTSPHVPPSVPPDQPPPAGPSSTEPSSSEPSSSSGEVNHV